MFSGNYWPPASPSASSTDNTEVIVTSANGVDINGTFIGYDLIILIVIVIILAYIALR